MDKKEIEDVIVEERVNTEESTNETNENARTGGVKKNKKKKKKGSIATEIKPISSFQNANLENSEKKITEQKDEEFKEEKNEDATKNLGKSLIEYI